MSTRYILRFDDICPTMNWDVWEQIEAILTTEDVKPILAVVPDNQDDVLKVSAPRKDFWDRVRAWQSWGWTIAMHGYQHRFVTNDSGILRVNKYSEFAGLPASEQERKLRSGLAIFSGEGIHSSSWIAPAHSFDNTTLKLLGELGFTTVSDGFFVFPHVDTFGLIWVPQQLGRFRRRPFGVWTILAHANWWTETEIRVFGENVKRYRHAVTSVPEMVEQYGARRKTLVDSAFGCIYLNAAKAAAAARPFVHRPGPMAAASGSAASPGG